MILATLIGSDIVNSLSPLIWKDFGVNYKLLEFELKDFDEVLVFLKTKFSFFNITSPYKKLFAENHAPKNFLLNQDKNLICYNTDILAIDRACRENSFYKKKQVLILGAGAIAEQVITLFLKNSKIKVFVYNRTLSKLLSLNFDNHLSRLKILDKEPDFKAYELIVNTSPVFYNDKNIVNFRYDKYNTSLSFAKKILLYQALFAVKILNKDNLLKSFDLKEQESKILKKLKQKQTKPNRIWLIGFMGTGKTEEGKKLAKYLDFKFIDTDQIIKQKLGMSIKNIFDKKGESFFREKELSVLKDSFNEIKTIISTGGGSIESFKDLEFSDNDFIVYLYKDFKDIDQSIKKTNNRPLWYKRKELFIKREAMYLKYANLIIFKNKNILEVFKEYK